MKISAVFHGLVVYPLLAWTHRANLAFVKGLKFGEFKWKL